MFIETQQEVMINKVKALYKTLLDNGYDKEDILILSSYNKGNYGTTVINNILQPIVNKNIDDESKYIIVKNGTGKDTETIKYCIDDIVIQTKNNYKAKVCDEEYNPKSDNGFDIKETFIPNGEIGTIKHIDKNIIYIKFNDEIVIYDKVDMSNVKLAYSISTHKSQGGNAKIIIFISPKAHTFMLNSNLMYVAVTRATERVFHFGTANTINTAIKKKADVTRHTWLKEYIIDNLTNKQNNTKEEN
jgi:exodeoxyribonuclease V alpha subunit